MYTARAVVVNNSDAITRGVTSGGNLDKYDDNWSWNHRTMAGGVVANRADIDTSHPFERRSIIRNL